MNKKEFEAIKKTLFENYLNCCNQYPEDIFIWEISLYKNLNVLHLVYFFGDK